MMMKSVVLFLLSVVSVTSFVPKTTSSFGVGVLLKGTIASGVEFDTVAREWRCKWSPDDDKASLVSLQKALDGLLPQIKAVDGVKNVERIVCGGCLDFKVITSLDASKFGAWEEGAFAPEADFLEQLEQINGVSLIETQTYTKMPC